MSKTLNIKQIESGLNRIRRLGHMEDTFEVLGHSITLRTIHRSEMEAANQFCQPLFEEAQETEDTFSLTNWLQEVKQEALTYAVMAIDDIDFHGVDFVSTGQIDEKTGKEIRVQKHVFVRGILAEWEDAVMDVLFKKFQELTDRAADKAKEGVEFKKSEDKVERITELEAELEQLKSEVKEEMGSEFKTQNPASTVEESLDRDALKDQVFSPMTDDEIIERQVSEPSSQVQTPREQESYTDGEGEYVYADEPVVQREQREGVSEERPSVKLPAGQREPENVSDGPQYVDADNNPLSGEELQVAQENERLYQQRQVEMERAKALQKKRRQPMNQVDARVRKDTNPGPRQNPQDRPTVNANKIHNPDNVDDLPVAEGFAHMEPESLAPTERPDWDNAQVDRGPSSNVNPNFQPPNQRKK